MLIANRNPNSIKPKSASRCKQLINVYNGKWVVLLRETTLRATCFEAPGIIQIDQPQAGSAASTDACHRGGEGG